MKSIVKRIYVRNCYFIEIYDIIICEKKLNAICETLDDTTELSRLLSELISNDDVLSLSFCLRNLFECVNMNNEKLFHRIFKTIKFKEKFENFKFNDNRKNYLQIFANVPSVDQINIVKNGKLSSLYEKGKSK